MKKGKEIALVTAGILAGIAVSGPAAQAAAGLMANASSQKFYINEQRVPLEAYEINGSNFFAFSALCFCSKLPLNFGRKEDILTR